jgi:hypothetical protein
LSFIDKDKIIYKFHLTFEKKIYQLQLFEDGMLFDTFAGSSLNLPLEPFAMALCNVIVVLKCYFASNNVAYATLLLSM